ncbi:hypothetical protein BDN72DRAFT_899588 [Pluteus cervinus]|uniref:Uncharacterized protein n=1 Tax=Pluteus cervinus TaxID=181527 RepID=A0ACD3AMC7_9AGAR|nr:hypothetical protein BDN72DRAFT_899588 [Pluteus cervinus]
MSSQLASCPATAAHQVFAIPELLELICEAVRSEAKGNARALHPMVLTSWAFATQALPLLWEDIDHFGVLLKTLPTHCWTESDDNEDCVLLTSTQPISKEDCQRYEMYSNFVRYITFEYDDYYHLDPTFFERLEAALGPQTLLPKLQHLVWVDPPFLSWHLVHSFFVPSLLYIQVKMQILPLEYEPTFIALAEKCPDVNNMQYFGAISEKGEDHRDIILLSQVIGQWASLTTLHVTTLTAELVIVLAKKVSPPLEHLWVYHECDVDWDMVKDVVKPRTGFSGLLELVVRMHPEDAMELFRICRFPLQSLSLTLSGSDWTTGQEYGQLLSEIHGATVESELTTLVIALENVPLETDYRAELEPVHDAGAIKGHHLSKILAFPNLKEVLIYSCHGFDIEDRTIEEIAKGLPYLSEFMLYSPRLYLARPPTTTIKALSYLAMHCPDLRTIRMAFDATSPQPFDSESSVAKVLASNPSQLERLYIPHSPVSAPKVVASVLSTLFPTLGIINYDSRFPQGASTWDEVKALLTLTPIKGYTI